VVLTYSLALFSGARNFIINGGQYVIGNVCNSPELEQSSTVVQAVVRFFKHNISEFDADHPSLQEKTIRRFFILQTCLLF